VDLGNSTAQPLDDLTGYVAAFMDSEHRWLTFLDSFDRSGGRRFVSLDLESGEAHPVLGLDEETVWVDLSGYSGDGRLGLVTAKPHEGDMQLWLLHCDSGDSRLLIEGRLGGGAVSPDGRWVAVSTVEFTDIGVETDLVLMETEGDETRDVGEGFRPVWVSP
jgi:hypothetical protein